MLKPKIMWCLLLLVPLVSCEKSSSDEKHSSVVKKSEINPLDYEIYDPETNDPYSEMRDGIISVFDGTNPSGQTGINRAIWLYEGALSSLLTDNDHNQGDSVVLLERTVQFDLTEGEILDEDLETEFSTDYYNVLSHLDNNQNQSYSSTDVQFIALDGSELELKVVTAFLMNGITYALSSGSSVPPASVHRYGGADAECGKINGGGAWKHVQKQARSVLPSRGTAAIANAITYHSEPNAGSKRYINGDYLFGQTSALHWPYPASNTSCVTASEQDEFAQAIVDQIYNKWGISMVNKAVRNLVVKKYHPGQGTANWWHWFTIGDGIIWATGPILSPQNLSLD